MPRRAPRSPPRSTRRSRERSPRRSPRPSRTRRSYHRVPRVQALRDHRRRRHLVVLDQRLRRLARGLAVARRRIHPRRGAPDRVDRAACCRAGSRSSRSSRSRSAPSPASITVRFLAAIRSRTNFRNLRSHSDDIARAQHWMTAIDQNFGQGLDSRLRDRRTAPRRRRAALEARLEAVDRGKPERRKLFARVVSIDDVLPADQPKKLAVLAQIRALLSSKDIDALDDEDRAEAQKLRPPADLRALVRRRRARGRRVAVHRERRLARQADPGDRGQGLRSLGHA